VTTLSNVLWAVSQRGWQRPVLLSQQPGPAGWPGDHDPGV